MVCGITIVKKEKDTPEAPEGEVSAEKDNNVPPLPALPNLNLADDDTGHEVHDLSQPSAAKKLKSADYWL